ncbi:MAG: hypothetical protein LBT23_04780 [Synergistaceae bacterium]|nr:hypothetical protein [Synergistaceae bacterium]
MSRKPVLDGNCFICGKTLGKTAMKNHILKSHARDGNEECCLLKIEDAYDKNFWLFVDIPLEKTLSKLDEFLRDIWLECCGHLSAFRIQGEEISKRQKLRAFHDGTALLHEYDFGSTSETSITFVGETTREVRKKAARLLARNIPHEYKCAGCCAPADILCVECMWDDSESFYCAKCADAHHDGEHEEMLIPVVNSPRMGMCGDLPDLDIYRFK